MPKASPIQESFSTGEISGKLLGRVNIDRYRNSLELCQNYIPTVQGPLERRQGTIFVNEVKDSSKFTRLVEFEFSLTQAYILEFGHQYIRVYRNYGLVLTNTPDPGTIYEIATPYTEDDLPQLRFTQSADVLYIAHPKHQPRYLERTDHDAWALGRLRTYGGPYLPINIETTTLTPASTNGTGITITASSTVGINGGAGFQSTDVERGISILIGGVWGRGFITEVTSTTAIKAAVPLEYAMGGTSASANWKLGAWSDDLGWPKTIIFHEDRLVFGGSDSFPQTFWGSNLGDYLNFEPTERDGTITDANGYSFSLNSNDVNNIMWMKSDEKGLPIGTAAGEWVVRPSSQNEAISATNVTAKKLSNYGSADIESVQLSKASIFAQRTKRKIRELTYFYEVDGFKAQDMTELGTHMLASGVKELKAQKEPQPIVWAVREDGVLTSMTYSREDTILAGWARHYLGGRSDVNGTHPIVESVAIIPSPDTSRYDIYLVVKRLVDGATVRYIEFIPFIFDEESDQEDAKFLDSSLTYYEPISIGSISLADPVEITSTSHGLSNGDEVRFFGLIGADELLNTTFTVANVSTDTFELEGIDGSLFTAYQSGGEIRKLVTVISGLDHLEGEQVSIFADGAVQADRTVSSGAITLQYAATKVHIGLNYISRGKCVRYDIGAEDGTSIGKTRRTHNVTFYMHRSLNLKIGTDFETADRVSFGVSNPDLSQTPELFTGLFFANLDSDYDRDNQICFEQDKPLPSTILAIMPQLFTQDR